MTGRPDYLICIYYYFTTTFATMLHFTIPNVFCMRYYDIDIYVHTDPDSVHSTIVVTLIVVLMPGPL